MPPPAPDEQIRFLTNIQRLLAEGLFTATYKYALVAVLADLSVELGDDTGARLNITTFAIAEKFIEYYWRHATPYSTASDARVLRQNTGKQAKIISLIVEAQTRYGDSLPHLMRDGKAWEHLVGRVELVVCEQPLWKLQTVGRERLEFLYRPGETKNAIELLPGVAYCFRQFHSLIQDAVRSAWLRDVRTLNADLLGETVDLREFLFGAERAALGAVRPVLMDLQNGRCFYCSHTMASAAAHVDHFVPWAKYPIDLAHNFVLADNRCNSKKRDRMPHIDHLSRWTERNRLHDAEIVSALKGRVPCDLACTNRIAYWAYAQTEAARGLTWLRGDELFELRPDWRECLRAV